jgi:hypothetical protein
MTLQSQDLLQLHRLIQPGYKFFAGASRRGGILRKRPAPDAPIAEGPQQAPVPELARELVAARLAEAEALRRLRCAVLLGSHSHVTCHVLPLLCFKVC